jgi:fimbrial isopeptide formation D2 family protein/LPXTG-motif cell wall-anchored protein
MAKSKLISRIGALALAAALACTSLISASAASIADATIDTSRTANLTLYKYDFTNAKKDGVWNEGSYVSTGQYDQRVNDTLGGATRKGDTDTTSDLGNGQTSNGYVIKGVEYTYLKVADITQFTESANDGQTSEHVEVLYAIDKTKGADMLAALGLENGKDSYANANKLDDANWYYQSDVLIKALSDSLTANATTTKNALEAYVAANGGTKMLETDEDGKTEANDLPLGLYLLVETKVPEMVTGTTDPCFISLPMTSVDGGMTNGDTNGNITTGGHDWLYDVTIYPKNTTGIVTLEKTVRESKTDTGKNNASDVITDGFAHNATASAGDTVEYQIISTLPTITSAATNISDYTFKDVLARGLSYNGEVTLEFFKDAACTQSVAKWTEADNKFTVAKAENSEKSHTMTIAMTDAGLKEINTANTAANNANGALYAGYSNYTLRIRYNAKLNSDESLVYGDNGNENNVVLTWKRSNDKYFDTLIDDCHIYTYAINVAKTFSDGKAEQTMFDHVLFKAQNETDGYYVVAALNETEGIWYVTGHTDKEAEATALHPVTWNTKPGQIILKGVEDDQYIWTELETANGYTLLKNNIDVTIKSVDDVNRPCDIYSKDTLGVIQNDPRYNFPNNEDYKLANIPQTQLAHNYQTASATVDGNDVTMLDDEMDTGSTNAIAPLAVVNTKGFETPMTGENGTWALAIGGVLVFCLGTSAFIFFLVFKKRKEQEDK